MCGLNLAYMKTMGGIPYFEAIAIEKATLLYNYIDGSDGYYINNVDPKYRSRINIIWTIYNDEPMAVKFSEEASDAKLKTIKGHLI